MIIEKAQKILTQPVCDNCLGRQFGQLLQGYTNKERGALLRTIVAMSVDRSKEEKKDDDKSKSSNQDQFGAKSKEKAHDLSNTIDLSNFSDVKFHNLETGKTEKKTCSVCNGFFDGTEKWTRKIEKSCKKYSIKTFLIGTKLSFELIENEEALWEKAGIDYCEPIKAEINREIGKLIEKALKLKYNQKRPDANIILNLADNTVDVQLNPLFIYGKYQKLKRGIPQTKWPSGQYKTSVEQIIAKPFMQFTSAKMHKLHGCVSGKTIILLNECATTIKDLENKWKDHRILSYDEKDKAIEISEISDFMKLRQNTYLLKTNETGRAIIASGDHPFFTPDGMKSLSGLRVGDRVAVNPETPEKIEICNEKLILSKADITGIANKYMKYRKKSYINHITKELTECEFIPLFNTNSKLSILARLVAFLFGDGHVKILKNRDVGLEFYGEDTDLGRIQKELKILGFRSAIHRRICKGSTITDYYGNKKYIMSSSQSKLTCYSKSLWLLLVALGAPVGNKVKKELYIPSWIKTSEKHIKREFLASLLGCEIDTPRLDDRQYNRKSFNSPRFSMNKIEANKENGIRFIEDIAHMLREFRVKTYKIREIPYTTRKDGNKTVKIVLDFSNAFENLIALYGNVGLKYCARKEEASRLALEYLSMKKYSIDKRKRLFDTAISLREHGYDLNNILKCLNSDLVSKKDLWLWIHKKIKIENIKIQNNFPDFNEWVNTATAGLKDGLVWETIEKIEKRGMKVVYDLTVPKDHNFFANGFLVSNCGREDIDARCLGWRPFVLELIEPKRRDIDLEKLAKKIEKSVKVSGMRLSDIAEVRKIKEAKIDKTYCALVECSRKIDKKELAKLKQLKTIMQKTPKRVVHRRADRMRKRTVRSLKIAKVSGRRFEMV
ncbi:hypothetical protein HYZ41_03385, partial [archaeon]|nr:hypothetical protein [archaeon]